MSRTNPTLYLFEIRFWRIWFRASGGFGRILISPCRLPSAPLRPAAGAPRLPPAIQTALDALQALGPPPAAPREWQTEEAVLRLEGQLAAAQATT